jgi:hypothetical protein
MKMKNKILKSIVLAGLLFTTSAIFAQEEVSQVNVESNINKSDIEEQNKLSDPKNVQDSSSADDIEDWSEEVLRSFKIDSFGENNGKFIVFAQQTITLKPTDPQFGETLINAYDKAMMNLQENYLMMRFGKTTIEKLRTFYSNSSTDANEIELPKIDKGFLDKIVLLMDKNIDLATKKLDNELVNLGVDPATLVNMPDTVKKDTFKDKFLKNTIRQASGSIAGLVPVQTKLIIGKNGNSVIGIVGIASHKTIQIAKDISLQRATNISGKGKDIQSLLPESKESFLGTLGVRLAYDLDGTPMIISYGMGSYISNSGDDYINDELRNEAKESAIANADGQIAEMINGRMNAKSERKRGEEIKKFVERENVQGSDTVEKTLKNIINITNKYSKSAASAKLSGISTVKTWRYTIPETKIKMVGTVRVWKYSTLNAIKKFNETTYKSKEKSKEKNVSKKFESKSKVVNSMDDF